MLQPVHGGANARPFVTHINAYDIELYLRIAPELYLKRLLVGGVERVFELGRNFRNEGADATHNPEFTMLEAYEAYGDYDTMRVLTQELIQDAATRGRTGDRSSAADPDGEPIEYDLGGDVAVDDRARRGLARAGRGGHRRHDRSSELRRHCDARGHRASTRRWAAAQRRPGAVRAPASRTRTVEPTFYTDFPTEVSPLTRAHRDDPRLAERWDLVAFGAEIGTAYSELVDPVEQRRRLTAQSLLAAGGRPRGDGARRGLPAPRWSTRCRRPAGWAWASTGWS